MPYQIIRKWRMNGNFFYGGGSVGAGTAECYSVTQPTLFNGRIVPSHPFALQFNTSFGPQMIVWGQAATPNHQYTWSNVTMTDIGVYRFDSLNGNCVEGNVEFMPGAHLSGNCNTGVLGYDCHNGNCLEKYSGIPFYRVSQYGSAPAALAACRNGCKSNCGQCPPGHVCFTQAEADQLYRLLERANIEFKT